MQGIARLIHHQGTSVQLLKRFYLSHSPMDYHPKQIMPSALFLATKTENFHTPLATFVEKIKSVPGLNKVTADDVLAPEFILTQGLRFCFDVRHPHRGLKGFYLECKVKAQMLKGTSTGSGASNEFLGDVDEGYALVKNTLNNAALLCDAYFLYTPSQILFAAWYLHKPDLTQNYLAQKLESHANAPPSHKLWEVIKDCARLLKEKEEQIDASSADRLELTRIDKKLYKCRNPEKVDLVGLNKAQKRDGDADGKLDEQKAKKRKMAREKSQKEGDDLFGPGLVKQ
jgi:cyclin H